MAPELRAIRSAVEIDAGGLVLLDIEGVANSALIARITEVGGSVVNSVPEYHALRANLPVSRIAELAARLDVTSIRPAAEPLIAKINTTEGDVAHRANTARQTFLANGTGVSIGVLSDGVSSLAQVQSSGDLPNVTVLPPSRLGDGGHGDAGGNP